MLAGAGSSTAQLISGEGGRFCVRNPTRAWVGPTGKVGRAFIHRFLTEPKFDAFVGRALCHNWLLESHHRLEIVRGSLNRCTWQPVKGRFP